ncbi:MAG: hypothetical protein ACTSSH_08085 [Candidatus Heimdallarchaeota archaeon]
MNDKIQLTKPTMKIGLISFTDPRSEVQLVEKREEYIREQHKHLAQQLLEAGFQVVDPLAEKEQTQTDHKIWAVNNKNEMLSCAKKFKEEGIGSLVIGCFAWNEPNLPIELAELVNCPIALVTTYNPEWPGITALTSTGASFWDSANNKYLVKHQRFIFEKNGSADQLIIWLRATCALDYLLKGSVILWGKGPALHMVHLGDDLESLKEWIIAEIVIEDQKILIHNSEEILSKQPQRVEQFLSWIQKNNCVIEFDQKMITKDSISK